jgi:hypothetical protein
MPNVQRLVYSSHATFPQVQEVSGINREVARILMQSRKNNPRRGLVGALYFGDGNFFQCLEGEAEALDEVCESIRQDPRHMGMKILGRHPIENRSFSIWAMKYVPNATEVQALLARHGLSRFEPEKFDDTMISAMLGLLRQGADADLLQDNSSGSRRSGNCKPETASKPIRAKGGREMLLIAAAVLVVAATIGWVLLR